MDLVVPNSREKFGYQDRKKEFESRNHVRPQDLAWVTCKHTFDCRRLVRSERYTVKCHDDLEPSHLQSNIISSRQNRT